MIDFSRAYVVYLGLCMTAMDFIHLLVFSCRSLFLVDDESIQTFFVIDDVVNDFINVELNIAGTANEGVGVLQPLEGFFVFEVAVSTLQGDFFVFVHGVFVAGILILQYQF